MVRPMDGQCFSLIQMHKMHLKMMIFQQIWQFLQKALRTDQWTNRRTNGQTHPLMESWLTTKNIIRNVITTQTHICGFILQWRPRRTGVEAASRQRQYSVNKEKHGANIQSKQLYFVVITVSGFNASLLFPFCMYGTSMINWQQINNRLFSNICFICLFHRLKRISGISKQFFSLSTHPEKNILWFVHPAATAPYAATTTHDSWFTGNINIDTLDKKWKRVPIMF